MNASVKKVKLTAQDTEKLLALFDELNEKHFNNTLLKITVRFSGRLRTTGGQYFKRPFRLIQISTRYLALDNAWDEIRDTLGHEMIHYWLDLQGKPCGHTVEFKAKMRECGFQRYSRLTPPSAKHLYICPSCKILYPRKKRGIWSCGPCSGKRFNPKFKLVLKEEVNGSA